MIHFSHRPLSRYHVLTLMFTILVGLGVACAGPGTPDPTVPPDLTVSPNSPTSVASPSPSPPPTTAPTATPLPPKALTVCQGEEPSTLFVYGRPGRAARNVMAAIYDGPIDTRDYAFQPVILDRLPSLESGGAARDIVYVGEGEQVLGAGGAVVELAPDVAVFNADGEEMVFAGEAISMTQMVVTFTLRTDVTWGDGERLTAEDSRFSYELAGQLDDAALHRRVDRTASYEVKDEQTVVWTGVPGYQDPYYMLNFYHPLPRHVLGDASVDELLEAEAVHRRPLGWGPFTVESWMEGERITLVRNPHYFRASEGLPYLDRVTFRFIAEPEAAVEALLAGECDVIAEGLIAGTALESLHAAGGARLISEPSSEWEHLDFGIQPARWSGRTPFFETREVRQAIAHCVDRERIVEAAFPHTEAAVAHSYVMPRHPLHAGDALHRLPYDPAAGRAVLEQAGWQDTDGDGMREAYGVAGIAGGTVFSATLLTTEGDAARQRAAEVLQQNLADCGVGVSLEYLPPGVFYADGPDGPVFGRQFDLALFSWLNGLSAPCELYLSSQIPDEQNWWATSNNPGYASEAYDAACTAASDAVYGTEAHLSAHHEAQRIFSQDLPVLPLYFVPRTVAVRPHVKGVVLDPSQQTTFWTIETMDVER